MITWSVSQAPDTDYGTGTASNTLDAWKAALSLAVRTAQRTPHTQALDITVGDDHARLYPGYDHTGQYDHAGTSRIAADLLSAVTGDPDVDKSPLDRTPRPDSPRTGRQACGIPWPACPQHGNTISSSAGRSRCRTCGATWSTSDIQPCQAPVTHLVTDTQGTTVPMCDGHTQGARSELLGATIAPLPAEPETLGRGEPDSSLGRTRI